jgi:hypothetical protein
VLVERIGTAGLKTMASYVEREELFWRRLTPPIKINDDELDRSVPTNLPLDPARDDPYQAFRRARGLPDVVGAWDAFVAHYGGGSPEVLAGARGTLTFD